ncbi:hypothetical protein Tco_1553767 [Tanacetum coccineum]
MDRKVARLRFRKRKFELKGQFLKELRENTFSGSDNKDTNEHIEKVLEIVDLFHVPNITMDQLMLQVFPISLTGRAKVVGELFVSVMPLLTYLNLGLGELAHTKLTVELADMTVKYPKVIAENVLVRIGALMNVPIFVGTFSVVTDFAVLEDMDAYRDEGMGDVIVGEPFLREVGIKVRRFDGMITIYNGDDEVTYQMV